MLMDSLEEKDSVLKSCNINKKTWAKRGLRALSLIIWSLQYAIQGTLFPSSRLQMIQAVDKRPWPKEMEVMKHETKYIKRPVFGMETGEEILIYNIYVKISNSSFTHTHTHWSFSASLSAWKSKKPCLGRLEWFAQDTRKLLNYWTSRHQLMKKYGMS